MSASSGSVAHVFDHVDQTLLECILRFAPSVRHLECIGLVDHRRTLGEHRAVEGDGADRGTVTQLDGADVGHTGAFEAALLSLYLL